LVHNSVWSCLAEWRRIAHTHIPGSL